MYRLYADWSLDAALKWMDNITAPGMQLRFRPHGPVLPWYIQIQTDLYTQVYVYRWAKVNVPDGVTWWILRDICNNDCSN